MMDRKQLLIMAGVGIVGFLWLRSRAAADAGVSTGTPVSSGTVGAGASTTTTAEQPNAVGSETGYTSITKPLQTGARTSWNPLDIVSTGFGSLFRPVEPLAWASSSAPAVRSTEVAPGVQRVIPDGIKGDPIAAAIAAEQAPAFVTSATNVWDARTGLLLAQQYTTQNPDRA